MSASIIETAAIDDVETRIRAIESRPLPANIASLLATAAMEAGSRIAWNFFESGETETYEGLRQRVNGIAARFLALGIGKGTHVGVMLPNIPAMPLTWLALGTLGAVMVPVNTAYRQRELAYVLNDSKARYVVLHEDFRPQLEAARAEHGVAIPPARTILVGTPNRDELGWHDIDSGPLDSFVPPEPVTHEDVLNIQYTSGTTGFPKGCVLTQKYWLVSGTSNAFRDGRIYERILASTPFFYMDPQWLLLMALLQRGTLFVARRQSTSRFTGWLREHRINFCLFPWVINKQPPREDDADNEIIRANVYGVPKALHAAIERRFGLTAREAFGMTETGPTLFMPIEATDMIGSGSCGRPAPFRECRVVDENGHAVPPGEIGELVVRGPGILSGYFGNAEATRAAFFGEWFRTGDLFRQDERGNFSIIGRRKDMVRRSGENIAARELEAVLNALPEVAESAIVPVPDELRGEEVKALLILREGVEQTPDLLHSIISRCSTDLAAFKVPRYFAFRTNFPRTGSMKIAKHLLLAESENPLQGSYDRLLDRWHV